jgi:hypothetical protein
MNEQRKIERPRSQADEAEALMREVLAGGPGRPRDLRAVAEERGLRIRDDAWTKARTRLGVERFRLQDGSWRWQLPGEGLEAELAAWLATNAGRFAVYCAERDRLQAGQQLELT